ncbi:MAG: glutaminase A, partial [Dehalococcoidia bacterium]
MAGLDLASLQRHLDEVMAATADVRGGDTAQYIPELASADPDRFGIALCTVNGEVVGAGETDARFSLQSTCKPFLYAAALAQFGRDAVTQHVGVEPTGEAFNAFVGLEAGRHRPHNPMVNMGAIAIAGMLAGDLLTARADVVALLDRFAGGRATDFDERVFASEQSVGHRNRAIAHLLCEFGVIEVAPAVALTRYLEACSTRTTVRGLAGMSAMLAAGGRIPGSDRRVLPRWVTGDTLSVMSTCGMYDAAGHFAFDVGLPAKSGVSGALMAVVPDRFGIAVFSPRVDGHGTSVRGLQALSLLSARLSLHAFDAENTRTSRPEGAVFPASAHPAAELQDTLTGIVRRRRSYGRRLPAQYAPALAEANVASTAIAVCTTEGVMHVAGEPDLPFSIQAAANPFAYAAALERLGAERVHTLVGVEPSGNRSDAIELELDPVRPFNPLENAGAIAIAALLSADGAHARSAEDALSAFAGAPLRIDERMLAGEVRAGERNRAIAALLRGAGIVQDEDAALDYYFRQCSVTVTASRLARMAAVLAGHGRDPVTGTRVIAERTARDVLSVMYTAGMHNASGEFAVTVGLPAKSGISGCIVAVAPGRMGVAV